MNDVDFIKASLTLHNAVPVKGGNPVKNCWYNRDLIKYGYIAPDNISEAARRVLVNEAIKLNSTFYKSWKDITSKKREDLVVEQIHHYFSVACSDAFNYPEIVYVPNNAFGFHEDRSTPLRFIKGLTVNEIKDLTRALLYKKVALKESTIEAAFAILQTHEVDITKVQNRDSKTYIFVKQHGIAPRDPVDILRCAVYDTTGELTLIKNQTMYSKIEEAQGDCVVRWLRGNEELLATIFNRYKPIFMSMKTHAVAKPHINRISKLSKSRHTPTEAATHEPTTGYEIVRHVKYLTENKQPKVYQVRNGKMWCTRDRKNEIDKYVSKLKDVLPSTFVQSANTRLALPTSEKNFCGAFPIGTKFGMNSCSTGDALIIGIHWRNQNGERVDLDLSAVDMKEKVGWNANYYTTEKDIIFSGDVTDACDGANEYLYFKNVTRPKVVLVNRYTRHGNSVPMDVIMASSGKAPSKNEILDDSKVIATASTVCDEKQKTLGVVYPTDDGPRFVLIDKCIGKKLEVGAANEDTEIMIDAFMNGYIYMDEYATAISEHDQVPQGAVDLTNKVVSKSTMLDIFK